ncbi:ATP-binding cassette domain-containing protein [Rufibacter glacialis]|uniref:ATP-binding cassette domain-containing protein n=1 Tax=Rufibacter glacialis TaxID=1259555 RepID=A0A5M8Q6J5_9BACT|nr:ATP-binding cassette domain-containing protein [Rufibacter glacialis]KAA6430691.1 ATP-binding cassette domain-containing protein [Rufibacter glacialis]GGK85841.1 molybdenum ABC transporter ATP-binding protein [Rufibacter glacialis]
MTSSFLSFQNVTAWHRDQLLFTNLDFEVKRGQHWALVGESGAGKTSLLQAMAGRLSIVGGNVVYGFYDDFLKTHPKPDVFFSFQNLVAEVGQKHSFRNVSSNTADFYYQQRYHAADAADAPTVDQYLEALGAPAQESPVWTREKLVQTFRLAELGSQQLIKLSNGETKRLLLAAALLRNPRLLLLDMPLTGLDGEARAHFEEILAEITASGITVVMATSALEIPKAITHVAVLQQGRLLSTQTKEEFIPRATHLSEDPERQAAEIANLLAESAPVPTSFQTILDLKNVTIRYGDKTVLDGVNWLVFPGERWALLGPNGSGKTTLLSLLNGDNPQAFAQDITLFDRRRGTGETIWDLKKKIGFVSPELFQFFPYQNTCLQVVESGLYDTLGLFKESQPQQEAKAMRWLELLEIAQHAGTKLRQTSASTQRLCLLARALIKHPPLLILDEPCQGLDPQQQHQFKQLLEAICAHSSTTLLYVTHYPAEIPNCVTKVLRLEQGRVQEKS